MPEDEQGSSPSIRFPLFDSASIRWWLHLVEAKLLAHGITEDAQRFAHAFGNLSPQKVKLLPILEGDKTSEELKTHLLQEYGPSDTQDNRDLLDQTQEIVGDSRIYLSKLKKILQDAQTQKDLLVQNLPEKVRRVVQVMPPDGTAEQIAKKDSELKRVDRINERRKEAETAKTSVVHIIKCMPKPTAPERDNKRGEPDEGNKEKISHLQQNGPPIPNAHLPLLPNPHPSPPGTPSKGTSSMGSPATSEPCSLGTELNALSGYMAAPTTSILHHRQPRVAS